MIRALVLLAALGVAGWGCGGDPATPAGYARDATRICRAVTRRTATVVPPLGRPHVAARALGALVAAHRDALEDLRDIDEPKPDRRRIDRWLATVDQVIDEVELARDALVAGDVPTAAAAIDRAETLDEHGRGLARAYGISSCRLPDLTTTA